MCAMLSRLWLLISVSWSGWLLYEFNSDGELKHMTLETWSMLFAPFLLRLVVLFIVFGFPRGIRSQGGRI